jgi:hypothetical protein
MTVSTATKSYTDKPITADIHMGSLSPISRAVFWVSEVVRLFFLGIRFFVWGPATFMKTELMG